MNSIKTKSSEVKFTKQLRIELTKLLYKHLYASLPALVILASVIAWTVESNDNRFYLTIWYITFIGVLILRGALAVWYGYTKNRLELSRLHYTLFIIVSSLIAILFGISNSVLMPHIQTSQLLVIIIMAGVTAGGAASLMPSYLASFLYMSFSLIPLIIWLFLQGNQSIYADLTIVMTTYWIFLLIVGYHGHKLYVANLSLLLEKDNILNNLSFMNTQLFQSIEDLKKSNEALHESEERFHQSFAYAAIGMALVSPKGQWLKVNKSLCDLLNYTEAEMLKMDFQSTTYLDDLSADLQNVQKLLDGKIHAYQMEKRYIKKNGQIVWTLLNRVLVRDANQKPLYFITQIQNIDLQKKAEAELTYIAFHDTLTELANRKMLEIKFKQVLDFAKRNKQKLAVLYVDIDYFKKINDSLGHEAGDILLKLIARRLEDLKRKTDILARFGGDEFVLILTEIINEYDISHIIKSLQKMVSENFIIHDNTIQITLSIGVSLYPNDGEDLSTLLSKADIALYRVKNSGRNGFQFYNSATAIISSN